MLEIIAGPVGSGKTQKLFDYTAQLISEGGKVLFFGSGELNVNKNLLIHDNIVFHVMPHPPTINYFEHHMQNTKFDVVLIDDPTNLYRSGPLLQNTEAAYQKTVNDLTQLSERFDTIIVTTMTINREAVSRP